jgi:hypothetical protein
MRYSKFEICPETHFRVIPKLAKNSGNGADCTMVVFDDNLREIEWQIDWHGQSGKSKRIDLPLLKNISIPDI